MVTTDRTMVQVATTQVAFCTVQLDRHQIRRHRWILFHLKQLNIQLTASLAPVVVTMFQVTGPNRKNPTTKTAYVSYNVLEVLWLFDFDHFYKSHHWEEKKRKREKEKGKRRNKPLIRSSSAFSWTLDTLELGSECRRDVQVAVRVTKKSAPSLFTFAKRQLATWVKLNSKFAFSLPPLLLYMSSLEPLASIR